ncbi:four helix bundle protein [Subsaxibacter sp. CAU 1640]|uniref:four helix bundle protein n=1 Tax=Subsaxibacter sp. CAU 1640 TaxID=2933271 RepID=UPI0020035BEB|nr:four helix bundle protein [Subsaxibacter sp. CAU 1640]MCK7591468.1 four helix bundle protein [Subsaxibacter sp. CAU 1640]
MNNYRELKIWQKSMELVEKTYALTLLFPRDEKYGLISQVQRSAISVPSNISEGAGRNSNKEFRNFLGIANGSLNELSTQLELAKRIGYLEEHQVKEVFDTIVEIQKMNFTLIKKFSIE